MQTTVKVNLRNIVDTSYKIVIGTSLKQIAQDIVRLRPGGRYVVITDTNVKKLYGEPFVKLLSRHTDNAKLLTVPAGERSKNRRTKEFLEDRLIAFGANRDSLVIALGGGMIGDLAGFVAATLFRGVGYVQIPTTLLAQVDSSIGGKVAVDHPRGKNLIGAFYQPKKVYIDVSTLKTLPDEEFANGMAEVIKYAAILDRDLFSFLERSHEKLIARDSNVLITVIKKCCELKKRVVEIDEKESNYRRILNFGHTIGHALESLSKYKLSHGKAIAIGMVAEATVSEALGLLQDGCVGRLESLLQIYKLPTRIPPSIDIKRLCQITLLDKKVKRAVVQYTLPKKIGEAKVAVEVHHDQIYRILSR